MTTNLSDETLIIPEQFNGPAASGNGGSVCGVVAELIEGDAEVTLRAPPPLEVLMRVKQDDQGTIEVLEGRTLVATGRQIIFDAPRIPVAPTWDEAAAASRHYLGHH